MLTAGANYDQKQDVAKQRTQKRSAHHVILSEYCQLSQKFDSRADGRVESKAQSSPLPALLEFLPPRAPNVRHTHSRSRAHALI